MRKTMYIHSEMLHPSMEHLHLGHVRNYIFSDILYKYYKSKNYDVIFINKYDMFGYIPDHWSIVNNQNPLIFLNRNIKSINKDFKMIGINFSNKRNILTSDAKYVKYTQDIFRLLYRENFIFKQKDFIIKCNNCNRVLCNEEVTNGKCNWCNENVNHEFIYQYFVDINKMNKKLLFKKNNYFDKKTRMLENELLKKVNAYYTKIRIKSTNSFIDLYLKDNYLTNIIKVPYNLRIINQIWNYIDNESKNGIINSLKNNYKYKEIEVNINLEDNIKMYLTFWGNKILSENAGLEKKIKKLKRKIYYNAVDWNVTRIRNWGEKMPLLICPNCDYECINNDDISHEVFIINNVKSEHKCPNCGSYLLKSTNVISPWLSSSWDIYYPFIINGKINYKLSKEYKYANYNFTREAHITKHLLYTRFITKFLYENNLVYCNEPIKNNCHVGNISSTSGTMSRIRGNSIYIVDLLKKYESDAIRLGIISGAKYALPIVFNESYIKGSSRIIKRLINVKFNICVDDEIDYNQIINDFNKCYKNLDFDKMFGIIQKIVNILEQKRISKKTLNKFLKLMMPIIPETVNEICKKM